MMTTKTQNLTVKNERETVMPQPSINSSGKMTNDKGSRGRAVRR